MLEQTKIHNREAWIIVKARHWAVIEKQATDESIAVRLKQIWRTEEEEEAKEEQTEERGERRRWYEFLGQRFARKNWIRKSRTLDAQQKIWKLAGDTNGQ